MNQLELDLTASRTARDAALQQVSDHNCDFISDALHVISSLPHGRRVTGEDVRRECEARQVWPHHPNAWGALCNTAVKRGYLIRTSEFAPMTKVSSHARATRVYLTGRQE